MNNSNIFLVDQDNVLADLLGADLAHIEKIFGCAPPREDITSFSVDVSLPQEMRNTLHTARREKGFYENLPVIPGAREGLAALEKAGFEVRICTAPISNAPYCVSEKLAWIGRELGDAWIDKTITVRDKTLVRGAYLLDDKPTLEGLLPPLWEHILFDQPYNRTTPGRRLRVWGEIDALLAGLP
jgi:5'-nucleotidase